MTTQTRTRTDAVIDLGRLALAFGRINRSTYHPDGEPESDTDHTVMLGLIACALAGDACLDVGLVAQYALVHDLPEVYAGDVCTLRVLSPEAKAAKKAREHAATERIADEFGSGLPWVASTLLAYEAQVDQESRFVRAVDKLLPKITHLRNDCLTFRTQGVSYAEAVARYEVQVEELRAYAADFPVVFDLRANLVDRVLALYGPMVSEVAA